MGEARVPGGPHAGGSGATAWGVGLATPSRFEQDRVGGKTPTGWGAGTGVEKYGFDKPSIFGEFPPDLSKSRTRADLVDTSRPRYRFTWADSHARDLVGTRLRVGARRLVLVVHSSPSPLWFPGQPSWLRMSVLSGFPVCVWGGRSIAVDLSFHRISKCEVRSNRTMTDWRDQRAHRRGKYPGIRTRPLRTFAPPPVEE